ncbi:MAG: hypothetical protein K8F91_01720 [Candidatus Obscuribacterales bacterium]|nr:hypothetical protein [Candidatus Obscuribacterales bacterium]
MALDSLNRQGKWDFVVLQETSRFASGLEPYSESSALSFCSAIKRVGARAVIVENYVDDDKQYDASHRLWAGMAQNQGASLLPVGKAWHIARVKNPEIELFSKDGHHPSFKGTYLMSCVCYAYFLGKDPCVLPAGLRRLDESGKIVNVFANPAEARALQKAAAEAVRTGSK